MEPKPRVRRRRSSTEREQLLAAYRRSGQTQREFAANNGVSLSCLVVWLRKFGRTQAAGVSRPFLQLPGGLPGVAAARAAYTIQFPGGLRLEVARGFEPEELNQLCRVLRGL